jgi:uncharacterized protein (TIGR03437 family)
VKRLILLSLLILPCAFGYITQTLSTGGQNYTIKRANATDMTYYLNDQVKAGLTVSGKAVFTAGSDPTAAAQAAIATWNAVSTANIHFNALGTTSTAHDASDCKNVIAVASSADDLAAVGGALAVTLTAYSVAGPVCGGSTDATPGTIYDADIIFSPATAFSTDSSSNTIDFQSVLTHELGHSMGANHSAVIGATMFWSTTSNQYNQRTPSSDDIGFVTAIYPAASANTGTLSGTISLSGSPVKYGLVTAIDTTAGKTYGAITGADGTFSVTVAPGSYIVYAEPFNSFISTNNIYTSTGVLDAAQVTTGYLPTFLGGSASPTATSVSAGGTATISLSVNSGTSSLTTPFFGIGAAGQNGDITSLEGLGPAISLTAGQSVDIGLGSGGIDANTTFLVFGRGISIKSGSIHADTKVNLSGQPLMRFTLNVPAQTDTTLASLWIVKGNSVIAFTGGLVITGSGGSTGGGGGGGGSTPAPSFTSSSLVNAASYGGNGTVSPGELASIYDTTNLSLGPTQAAINSSYDSTGNLPTSAGGVSVTFNGVAAPIYFAYAGQINLQVPFEVASGATAQVVVTYNGVSSAPVTVNVTKATPSFFTSTPLGTDAIIQNFPDYSLNKVTNPASRGGVVILYGTGIGKLAYPLNTGQPGTVPPSSYSSTYTCSFGGKSTSAYAYWNYGYVGEATWTVGVPADAPTGAVDLTCTDTGSGAVTPKGTIYLK